MSLLENIIDNVKLLPKDKQSEVVDLFGQIISDYNDTYTVSDSLGEELNNVEYECYVKKSLEEGLDDIKSGKIYSEEEIVNRSNARLD